MISFDAAFAQICAHAPPLESECIPLAASAGRVLARPVVARTAAPRHDVSTMDGYAVRDGDWGSFAAGLPVTGESFPGTAHPPDLPAGAAIRIFTGAPVPSGADRVIPQEKMEREGALARFSHARGADRHIRTAGSDFRAGDVLLPAGRVLDWRALTAAAAADLAEVEVHRRPRIAILTTGDELAAPGTAHLRAGAIPDSLSLALAAFARDHGADLVWAQCLRDDRTLLAAAAAEAREGADVLLVIGGASVGDKDHSRHIFGQAPDFVFSGVAMKPGKPVWFAHHGSCRIMGLPGNPSSALVTARLFLAPLLAGLAGRNAGESLRFIRGICLTPLPAGG